MSKKRRPRPDHYSKRERARRSRIYHQKHKIQINARHDAARDRTHAAAMRKLARKNLNPEVLEGNDLSIITLQQLRRPRYIIERRGKPREREDWPLRPPELELTP